MKRFWDKVNKDGPLPDQDKYPGLGFCWEWTACITIDGYGSFNFEGQSQLAHRISWLITFGVYPEEYVLHRCDNRLCVRPDHLFLGTNADNIQDMVNKGRQSKGLEHRLKARKPKTAAIQSRFKGVFWHKQVGKWRAQATIRDKYCHLGYFDNEEDAARAYQEAIKFTDKEI